MGDPTCAVIGTSQLPADFVKWAFLRASVRRNTNVNCTCVYTFLICTDIVLVTHWSGIEVLMCVIDCVTLRIHFIVLDTCFTIRGTLETTSGDPRKIFSRQCFQMSSLWRHSFEHPSCDNLNKGRGYCADVCVVVIWCLSYLLEHVRFLRSTRDIAVWCAMDGSYTQFVTQMSRQSWWMVILT